MHESKGSLVYVIIRSLLLQVMASLYKLDVVIPNLKLLYHLPNQTIMSKLYQQFMSWAFGEDIIPKFALLDNVKNLKIFKSIIFNRWCLVGVYVPSLSKIVDVKKILNRRLI